MNGDRPPEGPMGNPLMDEAALWFARMRGPEAERHRAAFEAWLARGALHRSAYNRAAEIFSMGKFLAGEQSASDQDRENPANTAPRPHFWRPALLAGFFVLMGLAWLIFIRPADTVFGNAAHIADTVSGGEQRTVELATGRADTRTERLADGSTVTLGPLSLLAVSYHSGQRTLRLERGRARFSVAHDRRPFVVHAGNGTVTALGTVFEVIVRPDSKVEVNLLNGRVDVAIPSAAPSRRQVKRLAPGQSIIFTAAISADVGAGQSPAAGTQEPAFDPGAGTGTQMREVHGARVADLIAEAHAASAIRIRLTDASIGEQRVSGRFRVTDPERLAERLAAMFDLTVDRSNPLVLVLRKRKP